MFGALLLSVGSGGTPSTSSRPAHGMTPPIDTVGVTRAVAVSGDKVSIWIDEGIGVLPEREPACHGGRLPLAEVHSLPLSTQGEAHSHA
jgi:hypothetical protein